MKTNPGGMVALDQVIGRDKLIHELWRILESQSVELLAERRIGKTTVIRKMQAEAQSKRKLAFFRDLEQVRTPLEFLDLVREDVEKSLTKAGWIKTNTQSLLSGIGGLGVAGIITFPPIAAPHWKKLLNAMMDDLIENQKTKETSVIFFWDELPFMLYNLRQSQGEQVAMEVLDVLRSLRQRHPDALRMVYTGSIGLHHVLTGLKQKGYANSPTNDMQAIEVPPLEEVFAMELAVKLMEGENLIVTDKDSTTRKITQLTDGMPFYIHHVINHLVVKGWQADESTVERSIQYFLSADQDPLDLNHYRSRIDTYYSQEDQPLALCILDVLATQGEGIKLNVLLEALQVHGDFKREKVLSVLRLLQRDHYLAQNENGEYRFRFSFIKRYWFFSRGLG
jgi:hypothetical protein